MKKTKTPYQKKIANCPKCGIGKIVNKGQFYGCTEYRTNQCDFQIWKVKSGKKISKKYVKQLINREYTDKIYGFISRDNNPFSAHLVLNADCKVKFDFQVINPME
jgi:DNA topoisomerase III